MLRRFQLLHSGFELVDAIEQSLHGLLVGRRNWRGGRWRLRLADRRSKQHREQ
jgi:hypothetical protein